MSELKQLSSVEGYELPQRPRPSHVETKAELALDPRGRSGPSSFRVGVCGTFVPVVHGYRVGAWHLQQLGDACANGAENMVRTIGACSRRCCTAKIAKAGVGRLELRFAQTALRQGNSFVPAVKTGHLHSLLESLLVLLEALCLGIKGA